MSERMAHYSALPRATGTPCPRVPAADVCLSPHEVADRLRSLARTADTALRAADVTDGGMLRWLRDELEDLAWRTEPS
jgi:hypothetical protein